MEVFLKIWARRDSNPRPKDYESSALPLRHRPVAIIIKFSFALGAALAGSFAPALPTSPRTILNRSRRQSATGPWRLFVFQMYHLKYLTMVSTKYQKIKFYLLKTEKNSKFIQYFTNFSFLWTLIYW